MATSRASAYATPRWRAFLLAAALAIPLAPVVHAVSPLDNDAGTGGDAGDSAASATPLEPGSFTGTLTPGIDEVDAYRIHVDAGQTVVVALRSPSVGAQLAMDGATGSRLGLVADAPRDVVFDVHLVVEDRLQYAFDLFRFVEPAQNDAGSGRDAGDSPASAIALPTGASSGYLDAYDAADVYAIPPGSWHLSGPGLELDLLDGKGNVDERTRDVLGIADSDPRFVRVASLRPSTDDAGSQSYSLDLQPVSLFSLAPLGCSWSGCPLVPTPDGGVDVADSRLQQHLTPTTSTFANSSEGGILLARDGRGRGIVREIESFGIAQRNANVSVPILAADLASVAFAPDGRLYAKGPYRGMDAVGADRQIQTDPLARGAFAFAPDGTMWIEAKGNTTFPARHSAHPGPFAFDAAGNMYYVLNGTIFRGNPGDDEADVPLMNVAGSDVRTFSIATSGSTVYVGYQPPRMTARVLALGIGAPGFAGFAPAFDLAPLADLRARIGSIEVGLTDATVHLEVTNVGLGATVGPAEASAWVSAPHDTELLNPSSARTWTIPTLAANETWTGTFVVDTTTATPEVHDVRFYASMPLPHVEANPLNDFDHATFSPRPVNLL